MNLSAMTSPQVGEYLKAKNAILIPTGSLEQHGPTGILGTDWITANRVAQELGKALKIPVAPPLCYGMASHHMDYPGSATLRPSVYQAMLCEVFRSFYHSGFRRFFVINGHGGNEPSLRSAFQEFKCDAREGADFYYFPWWKSPKVAALAKELFGELEGSHATPTEVSLSYFIEGLDVPSYEYVQKKTDFPWPLTAKEFRKNYPDGTVASNPGLARAEYGPRILSLIVSELSEEIQKALNV